MFEVKYEKKSFINILIINSFIHPSIHTFIINSFTLFSFIFAQIKSSS